MRDWMAGAALFAATAGVVLWQNAHVAVLWDLGYVLDAAARIASGQMPYRDFPLPHAPLTFLVQAAMIRLTGRIYFHHVIYVAVVGGLATVLTWRIALNTLRGRVREPWTMALLVAAPLTVVGIYSILPNPEYDCDCAFWILVAIWFLQRLDAGRKSLVWGFAAGVFACVPLFFKQNMGLPFLFAAAVAVVLLFALNRLWVGRSSAARPEAATLVSVLAGMCIALTAAALVLHWTVGFGDYVHWTIGFAAQRRLPAFGAMTGVYSEHSLVWTLPCVVAGLVLLRTGLGKRHWAQVVAFALLAAPFLFTLSSLVIYDDADERGDSLLALWPLLLVLAGAMALGNLFRLRRKPGMSAVIPLVLLVAINGTLMSQQLWGSTYAIWPLLILLVAEMLAFLENFAASRGAAKRLTVAVAALISATLLVCGGFYMASEERLSYAQLPDAPVEHSTFPQLAGLATPGPFVPEFDELLRFAQANIPFDDGLILIPGEEPFYFATGRVPRFPVTLIDLTTDPYSPRETAWLARSLNIRWLIVKCDLQLKSDPTPQRAELMQALMGEFTLAARLHGYDVYRR